MKGKWFLVSFCLIVFLSACQNKEQELYNEVLRVSIDQIISDRTSNLEYIILVPESGCPACLKYARDFMEDNSNNEKYVFILYNINDLKSQQIKFKSILYEGSQFLIDRDNKITKLGYNLSYPTVLKIDNVGKLLWHEIASSDNFIIWEKIKL